jgi:hypothetical protein
MLCLGIAFGCLSISAHAAGGVTASTPNLPALNGAYVTPAQAHQLYNAGALSIEIINIRHSQFSGSFAPPLNVGDSTAHSFGSLLTGDLIINGGPANPFAASAQVTVDVTKASGANGSPLGMFNTQMTQLDVTGLPGGALIRVDPTSPSLGQTTISDAGGGMFHIDSFFDIFTDLSLDGGQTWIPSTGSGHVDLVPAAPEPSSLPLCTLTITCVGGLLLRRRTMQ